MIHVSGAFMCFRKSYFSMSIIVDKFSGSVYSSVYFKFDSDKLHSKLNQV
jgi:hypothetical protein